MPPYQIIDDNIEALIAGANILDKLSQEQYNHIPNPYFTASIGKHFRHILDHYFSFINGIAELHVKYDQRDRKVRIETDPDYALNTMQGIVIRLRELKSKGLPEKPVLVSLNTSVSNRHKDPLMSSIARELVFLQGHTTHHYAIIAGILKLMNIEVDVNFGVAPSTLIYEEQLKCAQ